jgi:8-oxo-dGTP diphosphatase
MNYVTVDQVKSLSIAMDVSEQANVSSTIDVAVGVIINTNREVFISKRRPGQFYEGYWEFPGGKHEENETPLEALSRELYEEIGITVTYAKQFLEITHSYPHRVVRLHVWLVEEFSGSPHGLEGQECRWVSIDDLSDYQFPEGNAEIVKALIYQSTTTFK